MQARRQPADRHRTKNRSGPDGAASHHHAVGDRGNGLARPRHRIRAALLPLIEERARFIIKRETGKIEKELKKLLVKDPRNLRNLTSLRKWIDEFYQGHAAWAAERMEPMVRAYAELIDGAVGDEIGATGRTTPRLEKFVSDHAAAFGLRDASEARLQLMALTQGVNKEDVAEAIRRRLAEWKLVRPRQIALGEATRITEGIASFLLDLRPAQAHRGAHARPGSGVHTLSTADLDRIAYFLLHRYFAMKAVRLTVRDLAERGKVSLRLKRAARALGLRDYIIAPDIGRPPTAADLWKMRDATFETAIERAAFKRALILARQAGELGLPDAAVPHLPKAIEKLAKLGLSWRDLPEQIGFSFCRKGAVGPVLRGHAGKLDDSRAELVLAGSPEWTTAYTESLCKAGITVESVQAEGVTHEQRWVEASGEIVPDGRNHGGRVPLRRPDFWQLLENNIVHVDNQLIQGSAFDTTPLLEAVAQKGAAMIDTQRRKARILAVLCEIVKLRAKARQREVVRERTDGVRNVRRSFSASHEELTEEGRKRRDRKIADAKTAHSTPALADEIAETLRNLGVYDRDKQERLGKARRPRRRGRPRWPGLRATLARLKKGHSVRDLHATILRLHLLTR